MLAVSKLFVYPVKSLGGVELQSVRITDRGFEHDRRWMVVDDSGIFLSQRTFPQMALLQVSIRDNQLIIFEKKDPAKMISTNLYPTGSDIVCVKVWEDICEAIEMDQEINIWLSEQLKQSCKLVYMPDSTERKVDAQYAIHEDLVSFSDGYPILMIGNESLNELNSRLAKHVQIDRFRPNIVFTGGGAFEEDSMQHFQINELNFFAVKPCSRCVITTIDQQTGIAGVEPLKTLAGYRTKNNKVYFGQNILSPDTGVIKVGDRLNVI